MTPNPVNSARGDTLSRERVAEASPEVPTPDTAAEPQERVDLDAIRARWEAATPGPWRLVGGEFVIGADLTDVAGAYGSPNAVAIAHATTDIAALIAEVERLETIVKPMTERLLAALREKPRTTFAAALDEWRRSASPEVPSDLPEASDE